MTLSRLRERVPEGRERVVVLAPARSVRCVHRLYLGCGALMPTASRIPSALCAMANGVAKVPHNDANLVLASLAFAVTLRGLFGGRLSACAAPA